MEQQTGFCQKRIIVASNNKGKIREFRALLRPFGFEAVSMSEAGFCEEIIENGKTFEENARIKAKAVFEKLKTPVIADDSGLQTDFLSGAPGVFSARYAGEKATDRDRCEKLLRELREAPDEQRGARFVCVIYFIFSEDEEYSVRGEVEGFIGKEPRGDSGFGYDPIFMVNEKMSMAQLSEAEKNEISHRGKALRKLSEILLERL